MTCLTFKVNNSEGIILIQLSLMNVTLNFSRYMRSSSKIFFSLIVLPQEMVVCLSSMCLPITAPPKGAPSISQPQPPSISLDIMGNAAGGGGHPNHSEDLTHLSHSELNIAVLSSSDSGVVHQPPGLFGGKGPQKEDKDGSARSLTDVRKGLERDQRKKDKHLCCASIQGEAMVYGIEASADSMCNSEKTALGEIY